MLFLHLGKKVARTNLINVSLVREILIRYFENLGHWKLVQIP